MLMVTLLLFTEIVLTSSFSRLANTLGTTTAFFIAGISLREVSTLAILGTGLSGATAGGGVFAVFAELPGAVLLAASGGVVFGAGFLVTTGGGATVFGFGVTFSVSGLVVVGTLAVEVFG